MRYESLIAVAGASCHIPQPVGKHGGSTHAANNQTTIIAAKIAETVLDMIISLIRRRNCVSVERQIG